MTADHGKLRTAAFAGVLSLLPLVAVAQEQPDPGAARSAEKQPVQPTPPQPPPPEKPPAKPPENPVPDLDELLGLPSTPDARPAVDDPTRTDLERVLTGAEIGNAFRQAVTLMGDVAKRMHEARDAGLTTQRMQETIVRRLDQLISSLEQQQQQQQQQSQSSSQQQSQSNQRIPGQAQQNNEQTGENTHEVNPPGRRDGPLRPALDSARASWGNLPDRVRDMLVQGTNDRFSSLYKKLTEDYYQKLAEESKPR